MVPQVRQEPWGAARVRVEGAGGPWADAGDELATVPCAPCAGFLFLLISVT